MWYALGVIVVCALIAAAILVYTVYASGSRAAAPPRISITQIIPEGSGVAGQPVVVFSEARDEGGIARVELWVNGEIAATQENPNPGAAYPFETSQAWVPNGVGQYLAVMKAVNRGGSVGESDPVLIQVGERTFGSDPPLEGDYVVQEGDTWDSIAEGLGTTPDELRARNPGVDEPTPGTGLFIPPVEEGDAAGDSGEAPLPEDVADVPHVDPPGPPPAPVGEAEGAEPDASREFFGLPLPGGLLCLLRPEVCRTPTDGIPEPFPRPDGVSAGDPETGCGVEVFWYDRSENEAGFRLYRFSSRPRFRMDLLEMFGPSAGSGTHLSYMDTRPPNGEFFYAVTAFNAGGETWSAPSPTHSSEGCRTEFVGLAAVVEALELNVGAGFDRLYCYASLADVPFERIPHGALSFITVEAGVSNIAEHFSGVNKRPVYVYADNLNIIVECLGWQGEELINLGRFSASHPREEWDGRLLNATSDTGGFSVVYRINEGYETIDDPSGRTEWPLVDHTVAVPYNLRAIDGWRDCERVGEGAFTCADVAEAGLAWDYRSRPDRPASAFKVYFRREGDDVPRHYHTAIPESHTAPLAPGTCGTTTIYTVSAVVGTDPFTGESIESAPSIAFRLTAPCPALEITLRTVGAIWEVNDGFEGSPYHEEYETYGWFSFNGAPIRWNNHPCDATFFSGCTYTSPYYSLIGQTDYDMSRYMLNTGDGWRRGNNVIRIPIADGQALSFGFQLWDHDTHTPDDLWCGDGDGRERTLVEGRSANEWLAFDEDVLFDRDDAGHAGGCSLRVHVRGVPASAP
jgi:hypothetical protein